MREWNNPELWTLGAECTQAGGHGGASDGVHYDVHGYDLIGTSGPAITDPIFKKK